MNPIPESDLAARWLPRLETVQGAIRESLRVRMAAEDLEQQAAIAKDDDPGGDTIFSIDVDADRLIEEHCNRWATEGDSFLLVGEGVEPNGRRTFGSGEPSATLIVDPIDGTRGLMFDKRSAWCLSAVGPGDAQNLSDLVLARMAELPTSRQTIADDLSAIRGHGAKRTRHDLARDRSEPRPIRPSQATTLRHGFATVCSFFQGGKELIGRIDEDIVAQALGGWRAEKAEVYSDHYISSGGQLAELVLGRDRFVLDIRSLVHRALGFDATLASRPYDLCTALVAREAGVEILDPASGRPFDAPLDTTTNCAFVAYANTALRAAIQPIVERVLSTHGCI